MVPGYDLVATPVAEFGFDYIKAQTREALELGCDPDYNAWEDGAVNTKPDGDNPFRTGAGHVHIGWTNDMPMADDGPRQARDRKRTRMKSSHSCANHLPSSD